ncbi:MAG: hypothetical protein R8M38_02285, partial [Mariprofundaceae bacterium]
MSKKNKRSKVNNRLIKAMVPALLMGSPVIAATISSNSRRFAKKAVVESSAIQTQTLPLRLQAKEPFVDPFAAFGASHQPQIAAKHHVSDTDVDVIAFLAEENLLSSIEDGKSSLSGDTTQWARKDFSVNVTGRGSGISIINACVSGATFSSRGISSVVSLKNVNGSILIGAAIQFASGTPLTMQTGANSAGVNSWKAACANGRPTGTVTIAGTPTPTQNQTLTAANTLADINGPPTLTVTYQWNRNGSPIALATATTYRLVQADVGTTITVTASYTDSLGKLETKTSIATANIANVNDAPVFAPWPNRPLINAPVSVGDTATLANDTATDP